MGYWPSVRSRWLHIGQVLFFLRVYGPRRSRGPLTRKKRTRPISSHLDRTNLVNKGFIIWLLVKFCLRDTAGSPERARWLHLPRSGSQSQRAIWFILPARGASHIIRGLITFNKPLSQKILPDLCTCWSSVKGIAGNGENLYKFQVLTSQATCFSKARCTSSTS